MSVRRACLPCKGTGFVSADEEYGDCPDCEGVGTVEADTPYTLGEAYAVAKEVFERFPATGLVTHEEALEMIAGMSMAIYDFHKHYSGGLVSALDWYEEKVRLCRKLPGIPDGEAARNALSADGGRRAREALNFSKPQPTNLTGNEE